MTQDIIGLLPSTPLLAAFAIWAKPNDSRIGWWIRQIVSGVDAAGYVSSDLPLNTVQMGWDLTVNTGGNATANTVWAGGLCFWQNN